MARQGRRLLVAVLTLGLVVTGQLSPSTVAPALAEDPPLASPFLTDGDWTGTLNAAGPFDIEEFHGVVDYSGTFEFVVTSGAINAGIWSIDGAGGASHPRVTGTVTYEASGPMGGTADLPQMLPGGVTATYDLVVDRVPVSGTTEFGAAQMRPIFVPLVTASCDFAVGDWEVPANMVYRRAGGTSSITGFWFALRTGGTTVAGADPAVLTPMVRSLMARSATLMENSVADEEVDFDALDDLIDEAEHLNQLLILTTQCGGRTLRGWVNPIGPMMANLLGWAFNHPDLFDTLDLLRLIVAGVRTNAIGSGAPVNERTRALLTLAAMDLARRSERASDSGNCRQASLVYASATALGDPTVVGVVERTMHEVCE